MNKKATDMVAYITVVGWAIAFFIGTKEESKFHLNQGLILAVIGLALIVIGMIPLVKIVASILGLIYLAMICLGVFNAYKGEDNQLPLIGGFELLK